MLDYKLLEALAQVVREGGFDKAAKRLHLTQSAVSQRIRLLEDLTGMVLLTRTVPPAPTPGGASLLKHFIQVEHLEANLSDLLDLAAAPAFRTLALGINADSLATWFYPAVAPFLDAHPALLDLRVDDQDETHKLLRNGEVLGCISSEPNPVQGCRVESIGTMCYRLLATPGFRDRFFPEGLSPESLMRAPAVIYNHKDDLHQVFLKEVFHTAPVPHIPAHYIPSSEQFVAAVAAGHAYGMVPDLQAIPFMEKAALVDLAPGNGYKVHLFWHRWNIRSALLDSLSKAIVENDVIC